GFHTLIFEVIATIGFGFIILSLLLKASPKTICIIGLAIIFCHNLFDFMPDGNIKTVLSPLLSITPYSLSSKVSLVIAYPPIPWLGIMLVGFATGRLFEMPLQKRNKIFLTIGLIALLLFVVMRFINIYGDPTAWSVQKNAMFTFLSFINVTKYPPSLLFSLVTLGIMFLIFAIAEKGNSPAGKVISVYGKVPMFYFLVHIYLIHATLIVILFLQGFHWHDLSFETGIFGRPQNVQSGVNLWAVYVIWISVVVILYKPCVWYGKYKLSHKQWWLRYL
ncbi:MAG: DUF1624 domain-containing protein, partial [Ginsengibacter sp.]